MAAAETCYTEDYRHFDNLIWQVPNWASATFALTATAASVAAVNGDAFGAATDLPVGWFVGGFLLIVAIVLSLLWNVLFRFRVHQATIRIQPSPHVKYYRLLPAGHTSIQTVMSIEAGALYAGCLISFGVPPSLGIAIPSLLALLATIWADYQIKEIKRVALAEPNTDVLPKT